LHPSPINPLGAKGAGEGGIIPVGGVIATAREHEDWEQLSDALNLQGNTLAALRDWPAACTAYRECVRVAWGTMKTNGSSVASSGAVSAVVGVGLDTTSTS
jgi:hypothetical protein